MANNSGRKKTKAEVREYKNAVKMSASTLESTIGIKNLQSGEIFFVFIDKGKEQRYYCKSAFEKTTMDYLENQAILTMLKKEKIVDGSVTLLFQHPNYIERSEA